MNRILPSSFFLLPIVTFALLTSSAYAADCPATFGTSCNSVCTVVDHHIWQCTVGSSTYGSEVTLVEDYSADHEYEAWGYDGSTAFCCAVSDDISNTFDQFQVTGSGHSDTLRFYNATLGVRLQPAGATSITAEIDGTPGNDSIQGSDCTSADYVEGLVGQSGDDTIIGNNGDDLMWGGSGEDILHGDGGDDIMDGGTDHDVMVGGAGNDLMEGDDGIDYMSGGDGDDEMHGGLGVDIMCGDLEGASGDALYDGDNDASADKLWTNNGGGTTEYIYCESAATKWDQAATQLAGSICATGAGTLLSSRPAECP